ncbi:hypothetical protein AVEN_166226-1 [Araneus ventricosus]|uniref:Uncharacterized protein n=1 Tax=Araneus ventricosus TaxID=182803 RepID=A0A4Y2FTZ2_ARAVE|nr:hypothetical protein AVEN_166226-1 [Araneus ventricosus]
MVMETDALFTNMSENTKHKKQEKQHLHKLATRANRNSRIRAATFQYCSASNSLIADTSDKTPKRDSKGIRNQQVQRPVNTLKVQRRLNTLLIRARR